MFILLKPDIRRNDSVSQQAVIPDITDREFDRVIENATTPVLVEFWQPGCGGCQVLMKELEKIREETGTRLLIFKMNVQENYQIPAELEISSLPALALYRDGRFERFIGGIAKKADILKQISVPQDDR